jgi:hypothetical protein
MVIHPEAMQQYQRGAATPSVQFYWQIA